MHAFLRRLFVYGLCFNTKTKPNQNCNKSFWTKNLLWSVEIICRIYLTFKANDTFIVVS